jgi:hypothetical protein
MITKKCEACGKRFGVRPYRKDKARFCSIECWTQSSESKAIVSKTQKKRHSENPLLGRKNTHWKGGFKRKTICLNCGQSFSKRKDSPNQKDFCSVKCHNIFQTENPVTGKDSPAWRGGKIPRQLKSGWRQLRLKVIERDKQCVYCGRESSLCVHHILPVRRGGDDEMENLETVCRVCHPTVENCKQERLRDERMPELPILSV